MKAVQRRSGAAATASSSDKGLATVLPSPTQAAQRRSGGEEQRRGSVVATASAEAQCAPATRRTLDDVERFWMTSNLAGILCIPF